MKKLLLVLALLPGLAHAATPVADREQLSAYGTTKVSFTTGDSGETPALPSSCGVVDAAFDPATGGAASIWACPNSSDTTASGCALLSTLVAKSTSNVIRNQFKYVRVRVDAAPSAGTAAVYMYCGKELGAGGGSGGSVDVNNPIIASLAAREQLNAQDFTNQLCDGATDKGCPNPRGPWVMSPWHWGLARAPSMMPDRGANTTGRAWSGVIDSVNDFATIGNDPSATFFTLVNSEAAGQVGNIELPQAAGDQFCRDSATLLTCQSGANCQSIPSVGYPIPIVIRKVPQERYYYATVNAVTGCNAAGVKTLALDDSWPTTTDNDDQVETFAMDGLHPGDFGTRWELQNIMEAQREYYYQPRKNLVNDGRMDTDCAVSWTSSSGVQVRGSFNPISRDIAVGNGYGSVLDGSCVWPAGAVGATLTSASMYLPAGVYFLRWHQRTPLIQTTALGIRILSDSDSGAPDGVANASDPDFCGTYGGGTVCDQIMAAWHIDTTDFNGITPVDPDAGSAAPKAFYANDAANFQGWCRDWCWNILRFEVPASYTNGAFAVQFVAEAATTMNIDDVVMFPALAGPPNNSLGTTWLVSPGEQNAIVTGDSRCAFVYNNWDAAAALLLKYTFRTGVVFSTQSGCAGGAAVHNFLTLGVGCSQPGICGPFSYEAPIGSALTVAAPTKGLYTSVMTLLGANDVANISQSGTIAQIVANMTDMNRFTLLTASYPASGTGSTLTGTWGSFPTKGRIRVGREIMTYTNITGANMTISARGLGGTTAEAHTVGETVKLISLQNLITKAGSRSLFLMVPPFRGKTDGPADNYCTQDPRAGTDCSKFSQLLSSDMEAMGNY